MTGSWLALVSTANVLSMVSTVANALQREMAEMASQCMKEKCSLTNSYHTAGDGEIEGDGKKACEGVKQLTLC